MDNKEYFGSPIQAAEMVGILKRDEEGKLLNRSTAYAFADRLPDEFKSRIGASVKINLTRMQDWLNEGGDGPKNGNGEREAD